MSLWQQTVEKGAAVPSWQRLKRLVSLPFAKLQNTLPGLAMADLVLLIVCEQSLLLRRIVCVCQARRCAHALCVQRATGAATVHASVQLAQAPSRLSLNRLFGRRLWLGMQALSATYHSQGGTRLPHACPAAYSSVLCACHVA